ncbi:MAG: hypothetical protein VKO44_09085 [Cyanobacteriota bacterium]|nr:hypothetical protein [Cyanobacteriota bacterium]
MAGWASGFNPLVALSASVLWAGSAVGAEPQPMVECPGTQRRCTTATPCGLDQAPICRVIREGTSTVRGITYPLCPPFPTGGGVRPFAP